MTWDSCLEMALRRTKRTAAREGTTIFVCGKLPDGFFGKLRLMELVKLQLIASKIGSVRKQGYIIKPGPIQSLTVFFDVPKGDDIQMVYNGTSSALNDAAGCPRFSYQPQIRQVGC
jgi:hypothetical protein